MSIDQVASEALRLPARERALLAASLWESVGDPFELSVELEDDESVDLATARDLELERGEVSAISHDEMMRRLRR